MYQIIYTEEEDANGIKTMVSKNMFVPNYPIGSVVGFLHDKEYIDGEVIGFSVHCLENDKDLIQEIMYAVVTDSGDFTVDEEDIIDYIYPEVEDE
jgi:predicted nucleic-acid-binding protein